jgi:hypothetical protein
MNTDILMRKLNEGIGPEFMRRSKYRVVETR